MADSAADSPVGAVIARLEARSTFFMVVLPTGALAAAVAMFATGPLAWTAFPLDDAWIHRVYARSLAAGDWFAYNPGDQQAGFTSPLWVVLTAPVHWLSAGAVVVGVKAVGIALALTIVLLSAQLVRALLSSSILGGIAGAAMAFDPRALFSTMSGMETLLVVTLWLAMVLACHRQNMRWLIACGALIPLARPEAVLVVAAFMPMLVPWLLESRRRMVGTLAAMGAPTGAWIVFCLATSGRPLPNTYYQKSEPFALTGEQLGQLVALPEQYAVAPISILMLGWALLLTISIRGKRDLRVAATMVLLPFVVMTAVVSTRHFQLDGYYWTRWTDPAASVLTLAAITGLLSLLKPPRDLDRLYRRAPPWLPSGVLVVLAAGMVPGWHDGFVDRSSRLAADAWVIERLNVDVGKWVADNTEPDDAIGVNDAGGVRYFGGRKTVDLVGLNDADYLFSASYRQRIWGELDWLVVYPWFLPDVMRDGFEPYASVEVPPTRYTLCDCPTMMRVVVYRPVGETGQ